MSGTPLSLDQVPSAEARIDWARGRLIGFSVPQQALAFDVVQLCIEGRQVATAVADRSVFELARELSGLPLPSREQSAFELRIPQGALLPSDLASARVVLSLRGADGHTFFEQALSHVNELLHLTEGVPADLLYDVNFLGLRSGAVQGVVLDRHGCGLRPQLVARFNGGRAEPLSIFEVSADARAYHFQVSVRADSLADGLNQLQIESPAGQPLAQFPIQIGPGSSDATERRLALVEAQLAFLKQLMLAPLRDGLSARLALQKSEIVGVCSEMLSLQRTNLEREIFASVELAAAAAVEQALERGTMALAAVPLGAKAARGLV